MWGQRGQNIKGEAGSGKQTMNIMRSGERNYVRRMAWEKVPKRYEEHEDENGTKGRKLNEIRFCRADEKLRGAQRLDWRDANAV